MIISDQFSVSVGRLPKNSLQLSVTVGRLKKVISFETHYSG